MKELILDTIDQHESGVVLIRKIAREQDQPDEYIRETLEPGQDVSNQPQQVQDFCVSVWTNDVVQSWIDRLQQAQQVFNLDL